MHGRKQRLGLKQAEKLAGHVSPAEKLYIEAAKEQWKEKMASKKDANKKKPGAWSVAGEAAKTHVDSKETQALRKLVVMSPDDVPRRRYFSPSR